MELNVKIVSNAIEHLSDQHARIDEAWRDCRERNAVSEGADVGARLDYLDAQLTRLVALEAAINALTDDDVAAIDTVR